MKFYRIFLKLFFLSCLYLVSYPGFAQITESELTETQYILNQGIENFDKEQYKNALRDFNLILENSDQTSEIYGTALWGRALCHVILDNAQESDLDILMLADYVLCCEECKFHLLHDLNDPSLNRLQISLFADENQTLTISDCKDAASNTRSLIEIILQNRFPSSRDSDTRGRFRNFILFLELEAHRCCEAGRHWTICLRPLASRWKEWKDHGLPREPK